MRAALPLLSLLMLIPAAHAQQGPFAPPDGPAARRARFDRRALVDCGAHAVFWPPAEWSARLSGPDVHLTSPDGRVRLIRPRAPVRTAEALRERVLRVTSTLLDAPAALEPVQEGVRHNRWNVERSVAGTGRRGGRTIVIEARSRRRGAIWIALYADPRPEDRAAVQAVTQSLAGLVSHACECGYD
ncbi:MAG: hypothetical protein K8H88_00060, partial [Sandaracinaceae bacterium]|nr:hypothetical protein [Sandaracinaceae bacterium]